MKPNPKDKIIVGEDKIAIHGFEVAAVLEFVKGLCKEEPQKAGLVLLMTAAIMAWTDKDGFLATAEALFDGCRDFFNIDPTGETKH